MKLTADCYAQLQAWVEGQVMYISRVQPHPHARDCLERDTWKRPEDFDRIELEDGDMIEITTQRNNVQRVYVTVHSLGTHGGMRFMPSDFWTAIGLPREEV